MLLRPIALGLLLIHVNAAEDPSGLPSEKGKEEVLRDGANKGHILVNDLKKEHQSSLSPRDLQDFQASWMWELLLNLASYATIFIPGYLLRRRYLARGGPALDDRGGWSALERICFVGRQDLGDSLRVAGQDPARMLQTDPLSRLPSWSVGLIAFSGIQGMFLTWGFMQEKILTTAYGGERFTDAQFLVFMNRIAGFLLSGTWLIITYRTQPLHRAPFYKYSFASFSNTMSSWFQYEALKYVSFPTQILAKASKIMPVMLMGKYVQGRTYPVVEYVLAGVISMGMGLFLWSRWKIPDSSVTVMSGAAGAAVLLGYMLFDSFTSNWQERLFHEYKMSRSQMMFGISAWSMLFTVVALLEQGGFLSGFAFGFRHVEFMRDVIALSVSSALGSVFIYWTVQKFGAVVLTIFMTTRQAFSVLLSFLFYGHHLSALGVLGILLVFFALACQLYAKHRKAQVSKTVSLKTGR